MTYRYVDINLPLCALAFTVVLIFLRLRKPPIESYKKVFFSVDWMCVASRGSLLQPTDAATAEMR